MEHKLPNLHDGRRLFKECLQRADLEVKKKNLNDLMSCELVSIAKTLEKNNISNLSLFQNHADHQKRTAEKRKLAFLAPRHSEALFTFSRALACTLSTGGCLQELELGFALWDRDLKIIAEALSHSTTLKRLSFANSELGNRSLQILGKSLQDCAKLEILNLSACALTDAVAPLLSTILKAHICRRAQADWQASLRSSKGINALTMRPKGLVALDVSLNKLTDVTTHSICSVLKIGTPLEALNLRYNQLTRVSGKLLLEVMKERGILRFVDLRDNTDNQLMGVLEDGQHLTTFSRMQPPFWISAPAKKAHSKGVSKSRGLRAMRTKNIKPVDNRERVCCRKAAKKHMLRPQSAPLILPCRIPQRNACWKPGLILPRAMAMTKCMPSGGKNTSRPCTRELSYAKNPTRRRPSTCPTTKNDRVIQKKQSSSSCSTSSDFTAWEHDDANAKENKVPFQMSGTLGNDVRGDNIIRRHNPQFNRRDPLRKEKTPLLPLADMPTANLGERGGIVRVPMLQTTERACDKKLEKEALQKSSTLNNGTSFKKPSSKNNSSFANILQPSEWNSFLKEITQAILHLQERLDELIGPDDPGSLAKQATSQLQVLC